MATPVRELDLPVIAVPPGRSEIVDHSELDLLRDKHWLAKVDFGYVLSRHEDVSAILRDRRWHNASALIAEMRGVTNEKWLERRSRRTSILAAEGDVHDRLRRLVSPAFRPRAADRIRPVMRDVMNELIDGIEANGRCEFVAEVCEPYPIPIICDLLGAPKSDWQLFSRLATSIFKVFDEQMPSYLDEIMDAQDELDEYVLDLIHKRRSDPRDDLLTDLIAAEETGDHLSNEELVSLVEAVILAGTDTTRNQLACAIATFCSHPDQWTLLAERPDLAANAAEESLRYLGAVRGTGRFASEEIEYRDVLFPKGTLVFPSFTAANHDAGEFSEPHTFDITAERSTPHMTLGFGLHYCLGASLARAELQEALSILSTRLPRVRLDGDVVWKPATVGIWGPAALPIAFG